MTAPPEWAVPCPWCHASVGQRCTSPRGRRLAIASHDARLTAWTKATARHRDQPTGDTE